MSVSRHSRTWPPLPLPAFLQLVPRSAKGHPSRFAVNQALTSQARCQ